MQRSSTSHQAHPTDRGGSFVRQASRYRNWITPDGSPGPSGDAGFSAAPERYHLYVSYACPWAHRTLIFRALKGLERHIAISVVHPHMRAEGWSFDSGPGVIADPIHSAQFLWQVYQSDPLPFDGHATTPLLWDKWQRRVVNNESSDIIRMFNSAFDGMGAAPGDYYPEELRTEIDALGGTIYHQLNNGVYRAGFARSQAAYEEAVRGVFQQLDELEARLSEQRFLCGDRFTELDVRLFVTLIRFDAAYHGHFKCNLRRLCDYPVLSAYTRDLYQMPLIRGTVHLDHIKQHYYQSHPTLDPTGIVPLGPELNLTAPHSRAALQDPGSVR